VSDRAKHGGVDCGLETHGATTACCNAGIARDLFPDEREDGRVAAHQPGRILQRASPVLPMVRGAPGRIVTIASDSADRQPGQVNYRRRKAGIIRATKACWSWRTGITVN